ncbi:HSP70/90 co-chaperone, partial [Cryomyces antarcticus]
METVSGGLIKAGKKMSLLKILNSGKVEVVDGMLKIDVVPKAKAAEWIEDFKRKRRPT